MLKELFNSIADISYIREAVVASIGFFVGAFINVIGSKIKKLVQSLKRKQEIKKKSIHFEYEGIISLDHGDPFYKHDNLVCKCSDECFYLAIPEKQLVEIRSYNEKFISREDCFFKNKDLYSIGKGLGIENFKELIEKNRVIVAEEFAKRVKSGGTLFNGEVFGVNKVVSDRADKEENARLFITFYHTDHYTHVVMASVYNELRRNDHKISKARNIADTNVYFPFTASFGVNTILILEPENYVVLAKRSGFLRNMGGIDKWHVSMNEALTQTDIDEDVIDFERCVRRGLREELGIKPRDQGRISFNKFGDLFFVQNVFEMGITNVVKLNMSFEELKTCYRVAKDSELETVEILALKLNEKEIKNFITTNTCTPACEYNLAMLLSRRSEL